MYRVLFLFINIQFVIYTPYFILGDPGAASRDDGMFVMKVYWKIGKSPWALTLTEPVPEAFELPASDWPEKNFFWSISEEEQPGDSGVFLHDVVLHVQRGKFLEKSFRTKR